MPGIRPAEGSELRLRRGCPAAIQPSVCLSADGPARVSGEGPRLAETPQPPWRQPSHEHPDERDTAGQRYRPVLPRATAARPVSPRCGPSPSPRTEGSGPRPCLTLTGLTAREVPAGSEPHPDIPAVASRRGGSTPAWDVDRRLAMAAYPDPVMTPDRDAKRRQRTGLQAIDVDGKVAVVARGGQLRRMASAL